ncbi:MAG: pseudouridine synthase [Clostridia bacterium]
MKKILLDNLENEKVITYLTKTFPALDMPCIKKALRQQNIKINNIIATKNVLLADGDVLEVSLPDSLLFGLPSKVDIIYEDANIIIADKPRGLLCVNKDSNCITESSMLQLLKEQVYTENLKLCVKVDKAAEGLVIFSKNKLAHKEMLEGLSTRCVETTYEVYVASSPKKKSGYLENFLFKDENKSITEIYNILTKDIKKTLARYVVDKEFTDYSRIFVKTSSVKLSQIRLNLANIGCAALCDTVYGDKELNKKYKEKFESLAIKTYSYSFKFPETFSLSYLNTVTIQKEN